MKLWPWRKKSAAVSAAVSRVLPRWLGGEELALPAWARVLKDHPNVKAGRVSIAIEGDTDGYVREWLKLLGDPNPDQYWLEVAYQCAKLDLQAALVGTPYDPRVCGKSAQFVFTRAPQWTLKRFQRGRGAQRATQGREARDHYRRIRGALPF